MRTIIINNPGPQGAVGPQGNTGPTGSSQPFSNVSGSIWATTSSLEITGSFIVSGSSTFTNIGPAVFSGSVNATSGVTMSSAVVSGNVQVLGTASIGVLQINTTINSTGSNILGDAANDTQTLYGSVIVPTGSLVVSGSVRFRGSGSSSTTSALTVQNSSGTTLLSTRDDGLVTIGPQGWLAIGETGRYLFRVLNATGIFTIANDSTGASSIDMFGSSHATLPNLIRVTAPSGIQITGSLGVSSNLTCGTINPGTTTNVSGMTVYQGTIDPSTNYDVRLVVPTVAKGVIISQDYSFLSSPSALLEVKSNTKGFLPPRTNTTASISSPAQGLMAYLTGSTNEGLYYYNSGSQIGWHKVLTNTGSQDITGSLTMGGSIFTSGYIGYSNNSRYLQFNDVDSLVRLQGFNGIRLMTYDTTGYTDVLKIDGNVVNRTVQITGSLNVTGSITAGTGSTEALLFVKNIQDISGVGGARTAIFEHRFGVNALSQTQRYGVIVRQLPGDGTSAFGISNQSYNAMLQGYDYTTGAYKGVSLSPLGGSVSVGRNLAGTADDSAKFVVRGRGTTSATFGMLVEDSNGSSSFAIRDDGRVGIGTTSPGAALEVNGSVKTTTLFTANWSYDGASNTKTIQTQGAVAGDKLTLSDLNGYTGTSNQNLFVIGNTGFNPSSGTGTFNIINLIASISQSGTATGITRGIYVNPTVTSAANYRAIETTSGSVLFNHGATPLMFISSSGNVMIGTTTDAGFKLDVNGTARVTGAGSTSATTALTVRNSAGSVLLTVKDGGADKVVTMASAVISQFDISSTIIQVGSGNSMRFIAPNGCAFNTTYALPDASAQVDIASTTKGFLPPRMTNAQRVAISTPAVGLMVYCTDATEGLYIYKSTGWTFIV